MQSSFCLYLSLYLYFIFIFIINIKTMNNSMKEITFYIKEHPEFNTFIGNIYKSNELFNSSFISSIQLETINFKYSKCFRIDRYTGNLYTTIDAKYLLDNEKICIKNKNSKIIFHQLYHNITQYCSIHLIITINHRLLLSIMIEIEDINDNSPIFLNDDRHHSDNNTEIIYINETALPEYTKIPLKPAYDPDFNGYNKLYYYLTLIIDPEQNEQQSLVHSMNIHNPFRLHNNDDNDNDNDNDNDGVITHFNESYQSNNLYLLLIKPLDYEIQSEYQYNLTVCDNRLNQLSIIDLYIIHCTWKLIKIYINNMNDELPWFQQTNYSIIIHENVLVGNEIIKMTARDNDSIPYNIIKYRLIPSHDMILLNNENLFHIDTNTGIIILNQSIKKPGIYRFLVEAYNDDYIYNNIHNNNNNQYLSTIDHLSLIRNDSMKDYKNIANVQIHIIDVNNHAPNIEIQQTQDTLIYYLNNNNNHTIQHINNSKLILLKIPETLSLNTPIAYFKITDDDELDNADITCHLIRSNDNDPFIYTYHDNHKKQYELDIFQLIFVNRISDNTIINKLILSKNLDAENLSKNLLLNNMKLNFELESIAGYYGLLFSCHDGGIPQLTTSIPIIIAIYDIDEYYPNIKFINTSLCNTWQLKSSINHSYIYDININENIPIHSQILTLDVIDEDATSKLQFIQQTTKLSIPFSIEKYNGIIVNNDLIDYEYNNYYQMYISIYDENNLQKSLVTKVLINIYIKDLNDNSPEFIISPLNDIQYDSNSFIEPIQYHMNNLRIIELEEELIQTKPIGYVKAIDRDTGKNAEIIYFIAEISYQFNNTNQNVNIIINQTMNRKQILNQPKLLIDSNGALWCENKLDREIIPMIDLLIGAHDLGEPKLTSYTKIRILINDINDNNPIWQFPTETDYLVYVPKSITIGKVITRIHAIDKDELTKNGHITYYIYNSNDTTIHKSNLDMISQNIISQFFILNSNSGELIVKHSLIQLPDGFLDIWFKAKDNGKIPRYSIAKLVLYITTINNNHDHILNMDNSQKLISYYEENKNTKDITIQLHSMRNFNEILPMTMNLNSNHVYITTTPFYKNNIKTLSLLISGSIVGIIIIIIFLILFIICFKYNSYYHHHNPNVKCNSMTQINTIECSNNISMKLSNSNYAKENHCSESKLTYETLPTTSNMKLMNNNINNEENQCHDQINKELENHKELNRSSNTSLSINDTTIQTYIPMNFMSNCNELHYSPITSVIDISNKIPIHLLHVSNDTFAVPLCMTHDITTSNNNNNNHYCHNHHHNNYTTIEHTNNHEDQLTTHPLTIVATVVSTDNIKQGLLPILTEQSNNNNNNNDNIVDITNNKLYESDHFIKLENLTHSDAYYTTYTPCLLSTTDENTS
ncbi:unnamed protein product [Schistosoma intercalatum]|nr:unnamed protein product [Schistosoma intercalatum]